MSEIITAGVVSMISSLPSMKTEIINTCRSGENYLQELEISMRNHPEWQAVKVRLPFLEFVKEKFRIVAGRGKITAMKVNGGWLTA